MTDVVAMSGRGCILSAVLLVVFVPVVAFSLANNLLFGGKARFISVLAAGSRPDIFSCSHTAEVAVHNAQAIGDCQLCRSVYHNLVQVRVASCLPDHKTANCPVQSRRLRTHVYLHCMEAKLSSPQRTFLPVLLLALSLQVQHHVTVGRSNTIPEFSLSAVVIVNYALMIATRRSSPLMIAVIHIVPFGPKTESPVSACQG